MKLGLLEHSKKIPNDTCIISPSQIYSYCRAAGVDPVPTAPKAVTQGSVAGPCATTLPGRQETCMSANIKLSQYRWNIECRGDCRHDDGAGDAETCNLHSSYILTLLVTSRVCMTHGPARACKAERK